MKDKLVKFGHKPAYYIYRKVTIISVLLLSFAAIIAIPVTIKISTEAKAEEETSQSTSSSLKEIDDSLHY